MKAAYHARGILRSFALETGRNKVRYCRLPGSEARDVHKRQGMHGLVWESQGPPATEEATGGGTGG
jgi:hypothetical protein